MRPQKRQPPLGFANAITDYARFQVHYFPVDAQRASTEKRISTTIYALYIPNVSAIGST
jgi:hypothetical protein